MATRAVYRQQNTYFYDTALSPALGKGLYESCPLLPIMFDPSVGVHYFEDFIDRTIGSNTIPGWTFTAATTGGITISTTLAGGVALISAGAVTAGQGSTWQTAAPMCALGTTKKIWAETYVKWSGLSTTPKVQFAFGLGTVGSTALITSNAIDTTKDFFGFYGVSTTGVITTSTNASSTATAVGTGFTIADLTWYRLGILATPTLVSFYVNGTLVSSSSTNIAAGAVGPIFVNQGNATVTSVLNVDYLRVVALR